MNQLQLSHVALALDRAGDLPPVEADPSQMEQVMVNLLLNAADALGGRFNPVSAEPCEEGAAGFLAKPFEVRELMDSVRQALGSRSTAKEEGA